jgi:outer membrane receptor protein involved in Fe transport
MRVRTAMLMLLALALPAAAQEQRGSIEGVIKDSSGAVLPGVTVEARSERLVGMATSVSDGGGVYRFPALPPGFYEVTATLAGFQTAKVANVEVFLGQIKKVDVTLTPAGVAEQIHVVAESPLIDVKQNAAFANIHKEFIDKIPRGRDFTSVVTTAPGANAEFKAGGISIDGASGAENRYVIDGIDTTEIQHGTSGKPLLTDFVEEVQVKSSGYNAEFGGSTGGVINVISRAGSNVWRGDAGTYYGNRDLNGAERPTLRITLTDNTRSEYITFPEDDWPRWEPVLAVGGPIMKDRLWFFGGYVPELLDTTRTVKFNITGQSGTFKREDHRHNFSGNTSMQISQKLRGRFAANVERFTNRGRLPRLDGNDNPNVDFAGLGLNAPKATYSGTLDYVASDKLYFSVRAGHFRYDDEDIGIPAEVKYNFSQSNVGLAGVPASLQRERGFSNLLTNRGVDHNLFTRTGVNFDTTYYAAFAGRHTFKAGVQFDRYSNDVLSGDLAPYVNLNWGIPYTTLDDRTVQGTFGYYVWATFQTIGNVHSNNLGFYVQDSWAVNDRLTLNLGIRTEREEIPSFQEAFPGIKFDFADKFAPRLGFAYDVQGNGKWKAYGSFGIYYDIMKLEAARGLFGADRWVEHAYTLDTADWTTIKPPSSTPGRFIEDNDLRHVNNDPNHPEDGLVDPNLRPFKSREFTLGLDRELNTSTSLGVRFVRKDVLEAIEDQGVLTAGVGEVYAIANVGRGPVARTATGVDVVQAFGRPIPDPRMPKAKRQYDGVELRLRRRLSDNFALNTSYTWSRLWGNYPGLANSDEQGRLSPNVNRLFDLVIMAYDANAQPVYGRLQTDRPHVFKAQPIYDMPWGTTISADQYIGSGTPLSHRVDMRARSTGIFYRGRGSAGRTPVLSQTNLYVQHEFKVAGDRRVQLSLNVLNLFDQDETIDRFQFRNQSGQTISISEDDFFRGGLDVDALLTAQRRRLDPRFLQDFIFQGFRDIRFGVKFLF